MIKILTFLFGQRIFTYSDLMKYDQIGYRSPYIRSEWFIVYRADVQEFIPSKGTLHFGFGPLFNSEKECQEAIDKIGKKNLMMVFNP